MLMCLGMHPRTGQGVKRGDLCAMQPHNGLGVKRGDEMVALYALHTRSKLDLLICLIVSIYQVHHAMNARHGSYLYALLNPRSCPYLHPRFRAYSLPLGKASPIIFRRIFMVAPHRLALL
jgi:hypothetical protein